MLSAESIGTKVKSAETSYDVRHSSIWRVTPFGPVYKVPGTLYVRGDLPTNGFNTFVRTLATPYVTELLLDMIGLRGIPVLWSFGKP